MIKIEISDDDLENLKEAALAVNYILPEIDDQFTNKTKMELARLGPAVERIIASQSAPIDMLLFCPQCHHQHVDKADPIRDWENPPHRSHLCHNCDHIWRPADVATNGVAEIKSAGKADGSPVPTILGAADAEMIDWLESQSTEWEVETTVNALTLIGNHRRKTMMTDKFRTVISHAMREQIKSIAAHQITQGNCDQCQRPRKLTNYQGSNICGTCISRKERAINTQEMHGRGRRGY